jgi:hypothetical protein
VLAARTRAQLDAEQPVAGSELDGTASQGATAASAGGDLVVGTIADAMLAHFVGNDGQYRYLALGELGSECRRHRTGGSQGATSFA